MFFLLFAACWDVYVVPDGGRISITLDNNNDVWDGVAYSGTACAWDSSGIPVLEGTDIWLSSDNLQFASTSVCASEAKDAAGGSLCVSMESSSCAPFRWTAQPGAGTVTITAASGGVSVNSSPVAVLDRPARLVSQARPVGISAAGGAAEVSLLVFRSDEQPAENVYVEFDPVDAVFLGADLVQRTSKDGEVSLSLTIPENTDKEAQVYTIDVCVYGPAEAGDTGSADADGCALSASETISQDAAASSKSE